MRVSRKREGMTGRPDEKRATVSPLVLTRVTDDTANGFSGVMRTKNLIGLELRVWMEGKQVTEIRISNSFKEFY